MASNAMRQLEERHVASKIERMVWSNKMDLLALSNVRGEVALHRLTWQKVWSFPPPSEGLSVKGMAWRPDGKVIAIGYSNGEILLVDVENKEILHSTQTQKEVTCISWVQEREKSKDVRRKGTDDSTTPHSSTIKHCSPFLPKLPSLSRSFGPGTGCVVDDNPEDCKKVLDQEHINLLLVGLEGGQLHMSVFGLFPCGHLDMQESVTGGKPCTVLSADVSDDLRLLFVVLGGPVNDLGFTEISVAVFDISVLAERSTELHDVALKHAVIDSLLTYTGLTVQSIAEAWENILLEMDSKLASYADTVPEGSVSADFLDLLMFGTTSLELEKFLLHDLTEKGLKKLGHSIELSYSNIQKLVLKHLNTVGQSLAYHLAEVRGMSRLEDRYKVLGLEEAAVTKAIAATGAFLVKATEIQQVIDSSMKNYKAFFRWLYLAILRLSEERIPPEISKISQQELAFIADFLYNLDDPSEKPGSPTATPGGSKRKHRFNLERLGQYLVDSELTCPPPAEATAWARFLAGNPVVAEHPSVPTANMNLEPSQCVKLHFQKPGEGTLLVLDVQFYLPETLSVLLKRANGEAAYAQVPSRIASGSALQLTDQENRAGSRVLDAVPTVEVVALLEAGALRDLENMAALNFAVSGSRKVAVILSESRRNVRLYEMEVEEEEEEEDGMDGAAGTTDSLTLDTSQGSEVGFD
ncbi:anaphase-promoting complex subunit 4-like isoform X2 [Schistocerca gregaria]|uniref:anaphase-promoting complex subunit 4-like isoform X2 n=1 Tax=Schistocerca gregaria TaxID=7010 RepID=UPI00211DA5A8|nr:anaphase-promoting complex subunit 4-like isoform X2 [Schistocerca gregaria]